MFKRFTLIISVLILLGFPFSAQQIEEEAVVLNVEVPVRVFQGSDFIDNLTIKDFELRENGELQNVEAVYLIKKRNIERSEEKKRFAPETARNFYIFFEMNEYSPRMGQAVEYFIHNVVYPGDYLTIVTPVKTYQLRGKALEVRSREEITKQLLGILRRDTLVGNSEYREAVDELQILAQSLTARMTEDESRPESTIRTNTTFGSVVEGETIGEQLTRYQQLLAKMEDLRQVDQSKLLDFAEYLQDKEGQKAVFLFYQREYIPQMDEDILTQYLTRYQENPNIQHTVANLFDFYTRHISFDLDKVKQAYANASISIHFLFISKPKPQVYGVTFQEKSEDVFSAFQQMSVATGGFIDSSANPRALFQNALAASENYYLLYYSPSKYRRDGQFKQIDVQIKEKKYRVVHRLGYFAN